MANQMILPQKKRPIAVFPVQSNHGDVHDIIVCRTNGDSITVGEYKWIFYQITGRILNDDEIPMDWFAEEDRT